MDTGVRAVFQQIDALRQEARAARDEERAATRAIKVTMTRLVTRVDGLTVTVS